MKLKDSIAKGFRTIGWALIVFIIFFVAAKAGDTTGVATSSATDSIKGMALDFFEILFFLLVGQLIHILIKMRDARKKFADKFDPKIFWGENKFNIFINAIMIFIAAVMLTRAGLQVTLDSIVATVKPFELIGIQVPAKLWLWLVVYCGYLTAGYAIQSVFYWLIKGGLKKANIEKVEADKDGTDVNTP